MDSSMLNHENRLTQIEVALNAMKDGHNALARQFIDLKNTLDNEKQAAIKQAADERMQELEGKLAAAEADNAKLKEKKLTDAVVQEFTKGK